MCESKGEFHSEFVRMSILCQSARWERQYSSCLKTFVFYSFRWTSLRFLSLFNVQRRNNFSPSSIFASFRWNSFFLLVFSSFVAATTTNHWIEIAFDAHFPLVGTLFKVGDLRPDLQQQQQHFALLNSDPMICLKFIDVRRCLCRPNTCTRSSNKESNDEKSCTALDKPSISLCSRFVRRIRVSLKVRVVFCLGQLFDGWRLLLSTSPTEQQWTEYEHCLRATSLSFALSVGRWRRDKTSSSCHQKSCPTTDRQSRRANSLDSSRTAR